jgi:hypothetical protein
MKYYNHLNFDSSKYKKTSWDIFILNNDSDNHKTRMVVRVCTGRKYWPLFSVIPNFEMGLEDPSLKEIKFSLNDYTHPMIDRFIEELNFALSDIYKVEIDLWKIESGIKIPGYYSSRNF